MSQRETYPAGVPCWVDTLQDDPAATRGFYERVLGWRFDGDDDYAVARLHGAGVAGVGARPGDAPDPTWLTHVRVDDVDAAAQRAAELGATVEAEPLDVGWETESFGPATMFRLPGYVGGEPEQPVPRDVVAVMLPGDDAAWSVDFWIADLEAAIAAAEAAGGRVVVPPHDQPPVFRSAVLADPEGATFSLSQKD